MDILEKLKYTSKSILFLTIGSLLIFIVLVIYNYTVAPIIPGLSTKQTLQQTPPSIDIQTIYANKPAPYDTALDFSSIPQMESKTFSISFDCYLNGQYLSTDVPRVLLYFGTAPATVSSTGFKEYNKDSSPSQILESTDTDILSTFPNTNFIVYADDVKNDLKVGIVTTDKNNKFLELAPTITNIPINNTFQITIVVNSTTLEIYQNKQLLFTYILQNTITTAPVNATLYSPIEFIGNTIQIGNIQYFDNAITSSQVRSLTNPLKPVVFFTKST